MRVRVRVLLPRNCKSGVTVKQACDCSAVEGEIWDPEDEQIRFKERSEIPISTGQWSQMKKTLCIDFEPPRVHVHVHLYTWKHSYNADVHTSHRHILKMF